MFTLDSVLFTFWQPTPGITTDVIKGLVTKVNDDT